MNLTQIKGNTWVLEGQEFIPLYRLDERRCVLLDNGLVQEQKELEESLKGARRASCAPTPISTTVETAPISSGNTVYRKRLPLRKRGCAPIC